jgi:DNA-binding XRE family transcriptional regulator
MPRTTTERNPFRDSLGQAVRIGRLRLRLSQAQVAALAGVNAATVHCIETGKHDTRLDTATAVAAAVGVTLSVQEAA